MTTDLERPTSECLENKAGRPHVVIVGAGFAGIEAAKLLSCKDVRVTVVDRKNHHLFQPLLYQVATAGLSPGDIAAPVRSVLRGTPCLDVLMANVEHIDPVAHVVRLDHGQELRYDYLILATGATHSYFNHPEWETLAPGLKTIEDATEIRRRVLTAFEDAERTRDQEEQDALLTFAIVGGGPTGIELAGAIAELARYTLDRDFDHINPRRARIVLIEAGPKLLAQFAPNVSQLAMKPLRKLGIELQLGKRVTAITPKGVTMNDSEFLPARTVIWAAGVRPSPLGKELGAPLDRGGRVLVTPDLSVPGHPEVFVCGDLAAVPWKDGKMVPGMAPGAMQEGRLAARNILRTIKGEPTKPFAYRNKGSMATIGRAAAVVDLGRFQFGGLFAWLTWLLVHIAYLIGFRNRLLVLIQWFWSYLTYARGTRLITGTAKTPKVPELPAEALGAAPPGAQPAHA